MGTEIKTDRTMMSNQMRDGRHGYRSALTRPGGTQSASAERFGRSQNTLPRSPRRSEIHPASVKRPRQQWQNLGARKRRIAACMGDIENFEQNLMD